MSHPTPLPSPDALLDAEALARAVRGLREGGHAVIENLFPRALMLGAAAEIDRLRARQGLRPASTGRRTVPGAAALRGDSIRWLEADPAQPVGTAFLAALDRLREALNRALFLALCEVEAHYAHYAPGAGYVRHRDRFRDDDARLISQVCYLNVDWPDDGGGELRLHLPEGPLDVAPRLGTTVLFLSADIEHEVLPARLPRSSIAAWFRQRSR